MPKVRQIVKPHPRLQKLQRERRKRDGVYKSTYLAKVNGQVKIPGTGLFWVHDPAGTDANGNTIYGNTRKMPMLAGAAIDPRPNLKVDVQTIRGVDYIVRMNRAELDRIGYDVHQTNIVDPSLKFALIEHLTNFQAFATPGTGTVQVNGCIYRKRDGTYGIFSSTGGYDLITGNTPGADMQVVVCMWFDVDTEDVVLTVSSEESRSTNLKNPANIATRLTLINECAALAPEGSIGITAWVIYDDTTAITNNNKLDDLRGIIGQGGGLDDTAIHTDIAGEIEALDEKGTPVGADIIVIEDSEDSYTKKKVQFDNLPGGTDPDAIHINVADEYDTASAKGTPVAADRLLIEDSEDSFEKKYVEIDDLPFAAITHASTHEAGDSDAIDGDALEADTTVANYTPTSSTIGGHLEGIDTALGSIGGGSSAPYAILADRKASGTAGGGASATTQNARNLNTEIVDTNGLVSISSNQFTPISNKYRLRASAPAFKTGNHRLRLYNVTGATVVADGQNARSGSADDTVTHAFLECEFTANGTNAYRIDHYTTVGQATNGLGAQLNNGDPETYLVIYLEVIP